MPFLTGAKLKTVITGRWALKRSYGAWGFEGGMAQTKMECVEHVEILLTQCFILGYNSEEREHLRKEHTKS